MISGLNPWRKISKAFYLSQIQLRSPHVMLYSIFSSMDQSVIEMSFWDQLRELNDINLKPKTLQEEKVVKEIQWQLLMSC